MDVGWGEPIAEALPGKVVAKAKVREVLLAVEEVERAGLLELGQEALVVGGVGGAADGSVDVALAVGGDEFVEACGGEHARTDARLHRLPYLRDDRELRPEGVARRRVCTVVERVEHASHATQTVHVKPFGGRGDKIDTVSDIGVEGFAERLFGKA